MATSEKNVRASIYLKESTLELLRRAAYWDRKTQSRILEEALKLYFANKSKYEPIPS